jgi:tetratricopeptide (TPR) repeat protein
MTSPAELLLAGRPLEALVAADGTPSDPAAQEAAVRALVALVRPQEALERVSSLPREGSVAWALVHLATGEPGRGRALLASEPADDVLVRTTLAELHRAAGDPGRAVQEAAVAMGLAREVDPRWSGHAGLALGRALGSAGDEGRAEIVVRDALEVFETHCPETVLVAEALDAAGSLARRLREPARAVLLHRRALALWEARLGSDSGNTAACRYALAQALHRTGDFPEALATMQRAFLLTQGALGADHLDTWITRFELGRMEVDAGDPLAGFPRMEAARREVATRLGPQHPVVRAMDRHL